MASPVNVEDESAESPAALFFLDMSMKRTPPPMASPSIFFVSKGAPLVRDQKQSCQRESAVEEHGGRVHATDPPTSGSAAFCLSTALLGLVKGCILCGLELRLGLRRDLSSVFYIRFPGVLIVVAERDRVVFGRKQGHDEALLRLAVRRIRPELLVVTHERAAIHGVTDVGAGVEIAAPCHAVPDGARLVELEGLALIDRSDTAPRNTRMSAKNTTLY